MNTLQRAAIAALILSSLTAAAAPSVSGAARSADVVDSSGAVVASAYVAMAAQLGKDAGIAYRYGPDGNAYGTSAAATTLFRRPDNYSRCKGAARPDGSNCLTAWQVGGPRNSGEATNDQAAAGLYSTNQANVPFVADDPTQRVGVAEMQVMGIEFNTMAQSPQFSWTRGGAGLDAPNIQGYKTQGLLTGDPVAAGRCSGPPGFCAVSVIAFQNGVLGTAGSNTAANKTTVKLAANKVPTAIAMTNDSEFALVTVWDTKAMKGQIAVVALAGLCDGCKPGGPYYEWWHEWQGVYPGLPNMGNIGFMKILGYVDLPFAAPTEIAVTTGLHPFNTMLGGGNFMGQGNSPLQSHWQRFAEGGPHYGRYAKGGVAVVVSKSEKKVAFVDLKPLFDYFNGMYFSENIGQTANFGQADDQWPFPFARAPQAMPVIAKTLTLANKPTAVKTSVTEAGNPRAWVATQEGTLHIYALNGYAPGPRPARPSPASIAKVGSVPVGRNVTSLAHSKGEPDDPALDTGTQQVIAVSRGDRKVQWIRFAKGGNSGRVVRTLLDSRLVDPIAVEDGDNFSSTSFVLTLADYGGKKVANYRYGPVQISDRGPRWSCQPPGGCPVQPTNGIGIEFAGSLALPGKPFQVNVSNVP